MKLKRILTTVFIFLIGFSLSDARGSTQDVLSKFEEGNIFYEQGQYEKAVESYETIIAAGQHSGPIYYNLANSYFKNGNTGKAVLNYERARRLIPRDRDVQFNHQYVISQNNQLFYRQNDNFIKQLIGGHVHFYTKDEMIKIILIVVIIGGLLFLGSLYGKWIPASRRIITVIFGVIFLMYLTGFIIKVNVEGNRAIVIERTEAMFEPKPEATVHYDLPEGAKVKILKTMGLWIKVKRFDGKLGWVPKEKVEKI